MGLGGETGPLAAEIPAIGERIERDFWLDVFRAPVEEVIEGLGMEVRRYGPIHAFSVSGLPESTIFNLVLGAGVPGAVENEHLASAVEWLQERGVRHRVPVAPGLPGSGAAEDWLNRAGYEREWGTTRFVRDTSPPGFPVSSELEVDDFAEYGPEAEGFGCYAVEGLGLDPLAHLIFDHLPGREGWGCFAAIDRREIGVGTATMMVRDGAAQFGFAVTRPDARGQGVHLALLCRRIAEAAHAGCRVVFADAEERLDGLASPSIACRNLARAGFRRICTHASWRAPKTKDSRER